MNVGSRVRVRALIFTECRSCDGGHALRGQVGTVESIVPDGWYVVRFPHQPNPNGGPPIPVSMRFKEEELKELPSC